MMILREPSSFSSQHRKRILIKQKVLGGSGREEEEEEDILSKLARSELEARSQELSVGGENRITANYVLLLSKKHPNELVREFYASAAPQAQAAVQEAIDTLLGKLDTQWTTTAQAVAELCFKLQMTGYMLRNAEYVTALKKLLELEDQTYISLRKTFNALDSDEDGFLTLQEVEALFARVYPTSEEDNKQPNMLNKEARTFLRFFDTNNDGLISFDEFCIGLGGGVDTSILENNNDDDDDSENNKNLISPPLEGKIELVFPNGRKKIVDAKEYILDLQKEAENLRKALAKSRSRQSGTSIQKKRQQIADSERSLAKYIDSLSTEARQALTNTLTPDAQQAISQLVSFVLAGAGGERGAIPADAQLMLEKRVLLQLMNWQIVVGYRLRELEALDVARERAGL